MIYLLSCCSLEGWAPEQCYQSMFLRAFFSVLVSRPHVFTSMFCSSFSFSTAVFGKHPPVEQQDWSVQELDNTQLGALWSCVHITGKKKKSSLFSNLFMKFYYFLYASKTLAKNITERVSCLGAMQLLPVLRHFYWIFKQICFQHTLAFYIFWGQCCKPAWRREMSQTHIVSFEVL